MLPVTVVTDAVSIATGRRLSSRYFQRLIPQSSFTFMRKNYAVSFKFYWVAQYNFAFCEIIVFFDRDSKEIGNSV